MKWNDPSALKAKPKHLTEAFDEYLQLVVDPLESNSINKSRNDLKTMSEGPEGVVKFAQFHRASYSRNQIIQVSLHELLPPAQNIH